MRSWLWLAGLSMACAPDPIIPRHDGLKDPPVDDSDVVVDTDDTPDPIDTPDDTPADTGDPVDTIEPPDPTDGLPLDPPPELDRPIVNLVRSEIDGIMAGTTSGLRIVDAENGQVIYESNPDDPLTPASNTKLYTTATAMDSLGEEHRLRSRAYAPAAPDATGRVASLAVLVEHDSTWSTLFYEDEYFAADRIADQLYDAGVRRVTNTLTLAGEVLVNGESLGTYDADYHRAQGVAALQTALSVRGIPVGSTATSDSFAVPGGVLLTTRDSPPLSVVCHPLNTYSHNEMADILADHNGFELWNGSTYADGNEATLDFLQGIGVPTAGVHFEDGSGLSHSNTVTARSVTELLLTMQQRPAGQAWERTFSVAGVLGTIHYRMTGSDTTGRVYAKTGSLYNTIALSGVLYNKYDGHRYVFSILQNELVNQAAARALADDVVEVMADDLRGNGPRPGSVVLRSVINPGDGTVALTWDAATDALGYAVWTSTDGLVWDRAQTVVESGTSLVLTGFPRRQPVYVRVMAYNDQGEGEPSDVYAATPGIAPSRVLVVDGDDRWDTQWENTRGAGHDFVRSVVEALPDRTADAAANEAVASGEVDLLAYDAVIWLSGEESSDDVTFDTAERAAIDAYLAAGGNLMVSGAELGWDLDHLASAPSFYHNSLHATYVSDDAGTFTVKPTAGGLFDGLGELAFYTPARIVVDYPDVISPSAGGVAQLSYVGGAGGTAAVSYDGTYKVVNLAFPVESIDGKDARADILDRVLTFFGL